MKENEQTEAAMYFIRSGKLQLTTTNARDETYEGVSTLGAKLLLADAITGKNGPADSTSVSAPYTVQVIEDCRLGVLSLIDVRKVVDTIYMGRGIDVTHDSLVERKVRLEDLTKHRILGAGMLRDCHIRRRRSFGRLAVVCPSARKDLMSPNSLLPCPQ
jgi:hypothetical protein